MLSRMVAEACLGRFRVWNRNPQTSCLLGDPTGVTAVANPQGGVS
jgi:hypothetical protein